MAPEARSRERLVLSGSIEELGEDIIGKLARLRKAVYAFVYLKVYPPFTCKFVEILFKNKFLRDL